MKLTYFDLRGRAEPIRFILAAADVPYEDIRISHATWPELKTEMPWGQLPVLETDDEVKLAQGLAISRYLANKYKLTGGSEIDAAKCDEYVDAFMDLMKDWAQFIWEPHSAEVKAEMKLKFVQESAPDFFSKLDTIIELNSGQGDQGGQFLIGDSLTWADIYIGCAIQALEDTTDPQIIQEYPHVIRMRNAVLNQPGIKAWVDRRPEEDLMAIIASME